ncbi:hypothetical protein NDU88_002379 [Pleurodeles waltl]|uniref:DDE Tnp4 domain-containing protein n=1 Tax=Pleurodeles waltl TaxID=8319 RepID=A0AAV7VE53_PLEWA|nr:hypothetical protein NDU88_002379 [Pleurodeles waltl]
MVCLADQYISHVNAKYPESLHNAFILRNSSFPYVIAQLQRHRVWLIGDSGYPNLSWLRTPVRNPMTRAEELHNEAHGANRKNYREDLWPPEGQVSLPPSNIGSLYYSPKKVCQIIMASCMLHYLALRRKVPFLQEDEAGDRGVAAVDPVDSEDEEADDEDEDNTSAIICQYFQ